MLIFFCALSELQEAANLLEKRLKLIASLCEERQALNEKEREVTQSKWVTWFLVGGVAS